jgi:hypothetical protein
VAIPRKPDSGRRIDDEKAGAFDRDVEAATRRLERAAAQVEARTATGNVDG